MNSLVGKRRVIAADTPGYGGSDRPSEKPDIGGYAALLGEALSLDNGNGPMDLLGYHTGALVAAEVARRFPTLVRRLVLIGVPYFVGEERAEWRQVLARPMHLTEELAQFSERWDFFIRHRSEHVPLQRGFDNFVDELRAYPHGWWAHDAAFRFDVESCFSQVFQPTLVLNPANHLSTPSRHAAAQMPNCRIHELPNVSDAIFDAGPEYLADLVDAFLASERVSDAATPRE